jgi:excisionase family DNA binding protein
MLSKPFFTVQEIAELLKISEATIRAWIHDGSLRAIRFNREFRVATTDLEGFVSAHATRPRNDAGKSTSSHILIEPR